MEQEIIAGDGIRTNNSSNNETEEAWGIDNNIDKNGLKKNKKNYSGTTTTTTNNNNNNKRDNDKPIVVGTDLVHFCTCPAVVGEPQKKIRLTTD